MRAVRGADYHAGAGGRTAADQEVMKAPGILLAQLNGPAAGQTVFHIRFHTIPRYNGIDLKIHAAAKADFEKLKALAAKIAAAVR